MREGRAKKVSAVRQELFDRRMLYTRPDYYTKFHCTADACEDTCCAGWQIVIDRRSLKKYKTCKGSFRKRLRRGIDWKGQVFHQKEEKRCAFLNDENLCDLYTALGRDHLCRTCRRYPRHIEEFEGVRELTLSLSCPEVTKILMQHTEPVTFQRAETKRRETYEEEFDLLLYSALCDAREVILHILQDRTLPNGVRERLVYGIAHDMQRRIDRGELFACQEVLEKYQREAARQFAAKRMCEEGADAGRSFAAAKGNFRGLFQLELLRQEWDVQLLEVEQFLFLGHTAQEYALVTADFRSWLAENYPVWEIQKEQLLVYFVSTYFCGAVYDGQVFSKMKMALLSAEAIGEILKARWLKNGRQLDEEDVIDVVYRYSREVEHSDENLKKIEKLPFSFTESICHTNRT